jgi:hypothetical protein
MKISSPSNSNSMISQINSIVFNFITHFSQFPLKNRYYDAYNIIQAITMSFSLNFRDISKSKFFNKSSISFTIIFAEGH